MRNENKGTVSHNGVMVTAAAGLLGAFALAICTACHESENPLNSNNVNILNVETIIGTKERFVVVNPEPGIASEHIIEDIAVFYLEGFRIVGVTRQYRSQLEIPSTDDSFIRGLFDLPGVEELTVEPGVIMVKKNATVTWDKLLAVIREHLGNHLHSHY